MSDSSPSDSPSSASHSSASRLSASPSGSQSASARRTELRAGYRQLNEVLPDVMSGFGALHRSAVGDGALDRATKELIAVAIGIAARCDGCIALHVHDALRAGASRAAVQEAIGVAVMMGGGPASVYAVDAMHALDEFEREFAR